MEGRSGKGKQDTYSILPKRVQGAPFTSLILFYQDLICSLVYGCGRQERLIYTCVEFNNTFSRVDTCHYK